MLPTSLPYSFLRRPYGKLGFFVGVNAHGFALVRLAWDGRVFLLSLEDTEKLTQHPSNAEVILTGSPDPQFRFALRDIL